ncbi:hypothetical protein Tco_0351331 [Tanacetum coccineum]
MVVQEKKIVTIEDSKSKAVVATDNNKNIRLDQGIRAELTTFAIMALTELNKLIWSMEFDARTMCTLDKKTW